MSCRHATLVILAIALSGCGGDPQTADSGNQNSVPEDRGAIGVSLMTLTNPFFKVIGDSITQDANQVGFSTAVLGADLDPEKQANQVNDFIVQGVSAIVLAPYDSKAIGPAIEKAHAAGIPVFTVDNGCLAPDCKVVSHVATDNYSGGRQAGDAMIEALGQAGGKIAILDHNLTESCQLRVKGFKEVVAAYNTTAENKIEIVNELPCGGDRAKGYDSTQAILQSDPDIVGIFAINDPAAIGADAALVDANKAGQVKIIGFDGQPEGRKAIRDGRIYADPIQFPDLMGKKVVELIMMHFDGERVEPEYLIETKLYRQADGEAEFGVRG